MTGDDTQPTVTAAGWIMQALADRGIRHVFMVPGGGAMYLNNAAGLTDELTIVSMLHEQAAAIAAETYKKTSGRLAVCLVTSGPGSTNAITGVAGAWFDSTPMLVISGQAKRSDLVGDTGLRQRGVQEVSIVPMVEPVTKYATCVMDPQAVRYELEKALHMATHGRPGPVWLDIPLDVQGAPVDPGSLVGFDPEAFAGPPVLDAGQVDAIAAEVATGLIEAERPLILIGAGVRLAGAEDAALDLVESTGVPALCTWPAQGVVGDEHPLFVGRPGSLAPRGANFALQNADFLLCLGTRLDLSTTGYDPKDFGRLATKIVVDIDPPELAKLEGAIQRGVCADVGDFIARLAPRVKGVDHTRWSDWRDRCQRWKADYPVVLPEHRLTGPTVSTYHLADVLSQLVTADDVVVPGSSGLGIEIFQLALRLHTGQRVISTTALGSMGYGPPTGVGACIASGGRRTICVDGDGGLQLNVQELETIRRLDLPVKLFILCNDGYASIRASQERWFGRLVGADASSGMTLPALSGVAAAYGLPFVRLEGEAPLEAQVRAAIDTPGPVIIEVPSPAFERREPVQRSVATPDGGMRSMPIEDLAPPLDRDELAAQMLSPALVR